jgi:tRNA dimethylallyltransferase
MSSKLITILGPTACGKTKLAVQLCHTFSGEIISADSRQVYTGMDIGTGKDFSDYIIGSTEIPHHLIDIITPREEYNLFLFRKNFYKAFAEISTRNKLPFLVGGTGMYLSAVLQNYKLETADFNNDEIKTLNSLSIEELRSKLLNLNPKLHNTTDLIDKDRIIKALIINQSDSGLVNNLSEIRHLVIGIAPDRDLIKQRIKSRLKKRFKEGMIDEVDRLLKNGITHSRLQLFGLEYKFISKYLLKELNYNDMFQKLNSAINLFAKKQMTWFRKMEREGVIINWISEPSFNQAKKIIELNQSEI